MFDNSVLETMEFKKLPKREDLKNLFLYSDGELLWRAPKNNRLKPGQIAGVISSTDGYRYICIGYTRYAAHRLIWKFFHGKDPRYIDHLNGIRSDNRIENLRCVTKKQNQNNMKLFSTNTSGVTGVHYCNTINKWIAKIYTNNKSHILGRYKNLEDAIQARKNAEKEFGFHANHGRK